MCEDVDLYIKYKINY